MLRKLIILFGLLLSLSSFGQSNNDSISIVKVGGVCRYEQSGRFISFQDMNVLMNSNKEASMQMQSAKSRSGFASILSYAGGFLIGYPIGRSIAGGEANWNMALFGCGLVAIAIPISSSANKNVKNAVAIYNRDINTTGNIKNDYELKLVFNPNGLGMALRF